MLRKYNSVEFSLLAQIGGSEILTPAVYADRIDQLRTVECKADGYRQLLQDEDPAPLPPLNDAVSHLPYGESADPGRDSMNEDVQLSCMDKFLSVFDTCFSRLPGFGNDNSGHREPAVPAADRSADRSALSRP